VGGGGGIKVKKIMNMNNKNSKKVNRKKNGAHPNENIYVFKCK
jgi:hypothetical protein